MKLKLKDRGVEKLTTGDVLKATRKGFDYIFMVVEDLNGKYGLVILHSLFDAYAGDFSVNGHGEAEFTNAASSIPEIIDNLEEVFTNIEKVNLILVEE